jgi:hypothetical protein
MVAGTAGGAAIWFYLRNRSLYGSLTGADYNQRLFRFVPQDHTLELLGSPAYLLRLYDGLWVWTRFSLPRVPVPPVLAVAAVGLNDSLTTLRRARRACQPPLTIRDLVVPVLLPIGWFVLLVGGRRGRHRPPAIRPVPAGRRERRADRQRNPEHLEPAGVRSHPKDLSERGAGVALLLSKVDTRPFLRRPFVSLTRP